MNRVSQSASETKQDGPIPYFLVGQGCRWSKAEANALLAANTAWKTTAGAKSPIGGIAALQSLNEKIRDAPGSPKVLEP